MTKGEWLELIVRNVVGNAVRNWIGYGAGLCFSYKDQLAIKQATDGFTGKFDLIQRIKNQNAKQQEEPIIEVTKQKKHKKHKKGKGDNDVFSDTFGG